MHVNKSSASQLICWLIKNPQPTNTLRISDDGTILKTSMVEIKEGYNIIFFNENDIIKFFKDYNLNNHDLEEGLMQIGRQSVFIKILKRKLLLINEN